MLIKEYFPRCYELGIEGGRGFMLERLEEGFKAWDQEEEASWGEKG